MKKKVLVFLVLAVIVAGGVFAQSISAGIGGIFGMGFDGVSAEGAGIKVKTSQTLTGFGFYAFADATYVEANVGFLFGGLKTIRTINDYKFDPVKTDATLLTLSAYGKYPIELGFLTLYPMVGVQYDLGLSAKYDGNKVKDDIGDGLNRFWIKFGASADIDISSSLYFRPSFLYGINFGTKNSNDEIKKSNDAGGDAKASFRHGFDIRAAVGFRF
jgi:hypothetical protein